MRRVIEGKRLVQEFSFQPEKLPIDRPIVQYQRVSTDGQVKASLESLIMQDQKLKERLIKYGWKDIIPIDTDLGMSGQKRRDERKGLNDLFKLVEDGKVGAVACYDASRLFRDLTRSGYTEFINDLCIKHNVPVVTYKRVYFPTKKEDMDSLYDSFKEAAERIQWFHDTPLEAKNTAIEDFGSFGGHAIPIGYLVTGTVGSKHYEVYEPHARLVRWLYKRFHELDGSLARLFNEVRDGRFFFLPFEGVEKLPHIKLHKDAQGNYVIKSRTALVGILTNVSYIGIYNYAGVEKKEAHDPIIRPDGFWLFTYAYNRLSKYTLDGEINKSRVAVNRVSHKTARKALLENRVYCGSAKMYPMAAKGIYSAWNGAQSKASGDTSTELAVSIERLDTLVSEVIRILLISMDERRKAGLQDTMYTRLMELQAQQAQAVVNYAKQLANINKEIKKANLDKEIALEQEFVEGVREATILLKRLYAAKAELEAKEKQANQEKVELAEVASLLNIALEKWEKLPFERKQRFLRLLVSCVNVAVATQHTLRVDITVHEPFNCTLTDYLTRQHGGNKAWTAEELATLEKLYPCADRLEILRALPTRTWSSVGMQAYLMHLKRGSGSRIPNTSGIADQLTYEDAQLLRELGERTDVAPWVLEKERIEWLIAHEDDFHSPDANGNLEVIAYAAALQEQIKAFAEATISETNLACSS